MAKVLMSAAEIPRVLVGVVCGCWRCDTTFETEVGDPCFQYSWEDIGHGKCHYGETVCPTCCTNVTVVRVTRYGATDECEETP